MICLLRKQVNRDICRWRHSCRTPMVFCWKTACLGQQTKSKSGFKMVLLILQPDNWEWYCYCNPTSVGVIYYQWRTGPPGNREISRWASASGSFLGPRLYTQIYFIDNQLTQSTHKLSIQHTGHDMRRVSPSERTTVMYLIHSPPTRIKTISDENKKAILPFLQP